MIEVELAVVADLLLIMSVGITSENDEVIAYDTTGVESAFPWHVGVGQVSPGVAELRPVARVQLEGEHPVGQLRVALHAGHDASVHDQAVGVGVVHGGVRHDADVQLLASAWTDLLPLLLFCPSLT